MAKMIKIRHVKSGGETLVTELQYENVWKARGWAKVTKPGKKRSTESKEEA